MNAPATTRTRALAKLRELPSWPDIVVLLDSMIGAHPERTELELQLTLLVLQAAENAEKRALDRVNGLVAELRGLIAQHVAQHTDINSGAMIKLADTTTA